MVAKTATILANARSTAFRKCHTASLRSARSMICSIRRVRSVIILGGPSSSRSLSSSSGVIHLWNTSKYLSGCGVVIGSRPKPEGMLHVGSRAETSSDTTRHTLMAQQPLHHVFYSPKTPLPGRYWRPQTLSGDRRACRRRSPRSHRGNERCASRTERRSLCRPCARGSAATKSPCEARSA